MLEWKKPCSLPDEVLLILSQKYKIEENVKTEHNFATQAVYGFCYIYIYIYNLFLFHFAFTCTFTFNT